jgi:hypothetical protein
MTSRRYALYALLLWVATSTIIPVHASDWLPVTPEELQLTREPKAPGAAAIYLYRQVDRDDNLSQEFYYERVKILREDGVKYADVEIPYTKGSERIRSIEARTIRPDGSIVRFEGTIYDRAVVAGRGVKLMSKTFTLPEVGVGSIIEYRYWRNQDAGYVFDSHWILSQELFTQHARFSLVPSNYYALRWSWPRGMPEGTASPAKQKGRIQLETHDVPAFVTEELMPPENQLKYRVDFVYFDQSAVSEEPVKFWKAIDKDQFHRVEKFTDRRKAMEHAVAEIVQPGDSPETKLRKLYTRVQRLRNTSYEPPQTEEEFKRTHPGGELHNVEDVLTRGWGSAGQLNQLFTALASAAGLQASLVLVPTRNEYFFERAFMNERQLNSNVVTVNTGGKDWFLDPGVPFTPFGLLPWYETAVEGLQLNSDGGKWVTIPLPPTEDARVERQAQLKMDANGTLSGSLTIRYTGLEGAWRRLEERNEDDTERKKFLEEQVQAMVPSGIDVKLTNTPDWSSWDEPLVAQFDLKVPGWVAAAGQRALLKVGLFAAADDRTFAHQSRTQPIYFNFPFQYRDDFSVELPGGKHIKSLPKARNVDKKFYSYDLTTEEKDGQLHVKRAIAMRLLLVDAKFYGELRDFFQMIRTADEEQVVITQ